MPFTVCFAFFFPAILAVNNIFPDACRRGEAKTEWWPTWVGCTACRYLEPSALLRVSPAGSEAETDLTCLKNIYALMGIQRSF